MFSWIQLLKNRGKKTPIPIPSLGNRSHSGSIQTFKKERNKLGQCQGLSQALGTGSPKLAIINFWGVLFLRETTIYSDYRSEIYIYLNIVI